MLKTFNNQRQSRIYFTSIVLYCKQFHILYWAATGAAIAIVLTDNGGIGLQDKTSIIDKQIKVLNVQM